MLDRPQIGSITVSLSLGRSSTWPGGSPSPPRGRRLVCPAKRRRASLWLTLSGLPVPHPNTPAPHDDPHRLATIAPSADSLQMTDDNIPCSLNPRSLIVRKRFAKRSAHQLRAPSGRRGASASRWQVEDRKKTLIDQREVSWRESPKSELDQALLENEESSGPDHGRRTETGSLPIRQHHITRSRPLNSRHSARDHRQDHVGPAVVRRRRNDTRWSTLHPDEIGVWEGR